MRVLRETGVVAEDPVGMTETLHTAIARLQAALGDYLEAEADDKLEYARRLKRRADELAVIEEERSVSRGR
jgi:predicted deacylase